MLNRSIHFLLVEDDDAHAELVILALSQNRVPNTVARVADGEQALAYLQNKAPYHDSQRPDVILLDLKLPRLDGHELLQILKEDASLRSIPVVVLTTSAAEADRARAYQNHANSYLVKQTDYSKFNQMVQDLKLYWCMWNQPAAALPNL